MSRRRLGLFKQGGDKFDFGYALKFNGGNQNVEFSPISVLSDGDFTFGTWFNRPNLTGVKIIMYHANNSHLSVNASNHIRVSITSVTHDFEIPTTSVNTWYCLVFSRINDVVRVYVNGVESITGGIVKVGIFNPFRLGYYGTVSFSLVGTLNELGFKNGYGAIQSDVDAFWNNGEGADFGEVMGSNDLHYKFDQTGNELTEPDLSGNGNDGTLIDFPASGFRVQH